VTELHFIQVVQYHVNMFVFIHFYFLWCIALSVDSMTPHCVSIREFIATDIEPGCSRARKIVFHPSTRDAAWACLYNAAWAC